MTTVALDASAPATRQPVTLIDVDCHNIPGPRSLVPYLEPRWLEYLEHYGVRSRHEADIQPALRPMACRADSIPPSGFPGSDPRFSQAQTLDEYGIDISVLNNILGQINFPGGNQPVPFSAALQRANNDWAMYEWFTSDPRWRSSICVTFEEPDLAVQEIVRCTEMSDRFVSILVSTRTQKPFGNPKYEPLFEVASQLGLPITFHPGGTAMNNSTGSGMPSYYFENHSTYPLGTLTAIASLIFEGVLDRWPGLRFVAIEAGWSWAAPFAWRLDAAADTEVVEASRLQRKPSEYFADHFWFTTQPIEEPEDPAWFVEAYDQFAGLGLAENIMYSSDYPHWDFDSPRTAIPKALPDTARQALFCDNAARFYGFGAAGKEGR